MMQNTEVFKAANNFLKAQRAVLTNIQSMTGSQPHEFWDPFNNYSRLGLAVDNLLTFGELRNISISETRQLLTTFKGDPILKDDDKPVVSNLKKSIDELLAALPAAGGRRAKRSKAKRTGRRSTKNHTRRAHKTKRRRATRRA